MSACGCADVSAEFQTVFALEAVVVFGGGVSPLGDILLHLVVFGIEKLERQPSGEDFRESGFRLARFGQDIDVPLRPRVFYRPADDKECFYLF